MKDEDQSKDIVRCAYCGTAESDDWFRPEGGKQFYCTTDCFRARYDPGSLEINKFSSIVLGLLIALVIAGYIIVVFEIGIPEAYVVWILSLLFVPVFYYKLIIPEIEQAISYRKRIPEGSRRKEYVDRVEHKEVVVVAAAIICPVCNADIDPSKVDSKQVYYCEFCGANVKLPDWAR